MATAKEYFEKNTHLEVGQEWSASIEGQELKIAIKMALDFDGGSKHLKIYIPECPTPDLVMIAVLNNQEKLLSVDSGLSTSAGFAGHDERIESASLRFSGRILLYTPNIIPKERWLAVQSAMEANNFQLVVRDGNYVKAREKNETPLAFISHDSRDKDSFVRPLASKLTSMLCPVWYDQYSLVPGNSLRESIERGLKICPKCIVVLSKNFFLNPGWSKREFDSVYTREIIEGRRMMIPVWLGVTKQEVYDYSPILLDTFGISAELGVDQVAGKILGALNYTVPDLFATA